MPRRTAENSWEIQGRTVSLPVAVRDSSFATAVFCCSAAAARSAVTDDRLTPVTIVGRGIAVLVLVQYRDGDLGPYDEVGLMVAVRGPDRGAIGLHTVELPVTQTFSLEAGRAIWGLPKWLAGSSMTFHRRRVEVHLCEGAEFVLTAALDVGPLHLPVPVTVPLPFWSVRPAGSDAGELLYGVLRLRLEGMRIRPGGARLVLGEHRMARTARALGMSRRPLCTTLSRMTAAFDAFTPVHG